MFKDKLAGSSFWNKVLLQSIWPLSVVMVYPICYFFKRLDIIEKLFTINFVAACVIFYFLIIALSIYIYEQQVTPLQRRMKMLKEILKTYNSFKETNVRWHYTIVFSGDTLNFEIEDLTPIPFCEIHNKDLIYSDLSKMYVCIDCVKNKSVRMDEPGTRRRITSLLNQKINHLKPDLRDNGLNF